MKYSKQLLGFGSLALLSAALLSGCAGKSTGPGPGTGGGTGTGSGPVSIQQLPDEFAAAYCDNIGSCCQTADIAFDLATCKQNFSALIDLALTMERSPNIKYDAAIAGRCIAAYASELKRCTLNEKTINDACWDVFTGSVPAGAACALDAECMHSANGRASCVGPPSSPGGPATCEVIDTGDTSPHGKRGDPCSGTCQGTDCSGTAPSSGGSAPPICFNTDGLYCDPSQTCQPVAAIGQPCSFAGCKSGSFCNGGLCAASLPDGAACTQNSECVGGSCMSAGPSSPGSGAPTGICGDPVFVSDSACMGTPFQD